MKYNKENRYFQIGINGLIIICGGIFFYYLLFHLEKFTGVLKYILSILTPIITGFVIAYVLNPIMIFIENKIIYNIFKKSSKINKNNKKVSRIIRFITTFFTVILFLLLLYGLVIMVVPQIIMNIQNIIDKVPLYSRNITSYYNNMLKQYPYIDAMLTNYWSDITNWFVVKGRPAIEGMISKTSTTLLGSIINIFKSLLNFIIGIIISIYLLLDKEKFMAQSKKCIYAFMKEEKANNFLNNLRYSNKIFGGFLSGKVVDSCIIGFICYICMIIFKFPYPALLSLIIGITNIIPYFGPFIGAIPTAFIVLLVQPRRFLIFVIFILILQQFDGNILGPKILGESTGLSSFWVIFSITIFSGLFGIIGMFIGVPVFAVIYSAFRTFVDERLVKKNMPASTAYYQVSDFYYDEEGHMINDGGSFKFTKDTFENITPVISDDEKQRRSTKVDELNNKDKNDDESKKSKIN